MKKFVKSLEILVFVLLFVGCFGTDGEEKVAIIGISTQSDATIIVGNPITLSAITLTKSDGSTEKISPTEVTWTSNNTSVVIIDGLRVEGVSKGSAIITGEYEGVSDTFDVKVETNEVLDELVEGNNLVDNGNFTQESSTGANFTIDGGEITYEISTLGEGQWDDQILNEVQVSEEGNYIVKFTASSTVDRDILFRVDGVELAKTSSDVICSLTSEPKEFALNVTDVSGLAGNPRLKIVIALGKLETTGTTSIASTATLNKFSLATLSKSVETDKTLLEAAIIKAQDIHDNGSVEEYPGDKETYQTAIEASQAVVDNLSATQEEVNAAVDALETATDVFGGAEPGNLIDNRNFTNESSTGANFSVVDGEATYEITTLGEGQWDDQIFNEVQVSEEGNYIVKFTASSTVDRDILFRVDGVELAKTSSDVICSLTSEPKEFTLNVTDVSGLAGNPRLKIVIALGRLEAVGTNSAASTVTLDDFYLGVSKKINK